jgi:hypothetical protein
LAATTALAAFSTLLTTFLTALATTSFFTTTLLTALVLFRHLTSLLVEVNDRLTCIKESSSYSGLNSFKTSLATALL